ncbi:dolichyl-diphosphooligosaccharide--protein glycosyltransferase 48 kDa subunit precursor [Reticulomyxa filosa]|uniref:Dolichyl-diphosphooligosaccharide--protein glycosyltransferase 48 kDa subunit n=1 Tax=Reticulomyxa filosa TaxID=46433 RepID=X6NWN7_RETFI|nr:dolichyl-diphosphooligosaccharide--protein glycosyltransferase 48 kDa subunit precursor [Reticulomyxa filosa]|eukprot:ETO30249.1 dolichyl-diphosphooligosaccharide--protein glycosyltransferase 48 kDa subunit precursor [Reticulomyxa filosa]
MFKVLLFLCVLLFVAYSAAPRTLVLVDDDLAKNIYSRFLRSLQNRGHKLEIKKASDTSVSLFTFGVRNYENISKTNNIINAKKKQQINKQKKWTQDESGELKLTNLLEFVDNGGNALVTLEEQNSEVIRKFGERCGIVIHPDKGEEIYRNQKINKNKNNRINVYEMFEQSHVRDHGSYDNEKDPINHRVIVTDGWSDYEGVFSGKTKPSAPVLFDGIGLHFKDNAHLNTKLLSGISLLFISVLSDCIVLHFFKNKSIPFSTFAIKYIKKALQQHILTNRLKAPLTKLLFKVAIHWL